MEMNERFDACNVHFFGKEGMEMTPNRPRKIPIGFVLALCTAFLLTAASAFATATADIQIEKGSDVSQVAAGGTITYTITATNLGPNGASQVVIEDDVPLTLTNIVIDSVTQPSDCAVVGNTITCQMQGLGASGSINTIVFHADVVGGTEKGTTITNCAFEKSSNSTDPDHTNDQAPFSCGQGVSVVEIADLSVAKTQTDPLPANNPVLGGSNVTYHIVVTNNGPSTATNVVVGDDITVGSATFVSATSNDAGLDCSGFLAFGDSCTATSLDSGSSLSFDLVVTVPNDGTSSITDTATTSSDTTDNDTSNNTSSVTTTICQSVDLALSKACLQWCPPVSSRTPGASVCEPLPITEIQGGSDFQYEITVTNNDPSVDATNVTISDTLPAGVTYVSDDQSCDTSGLPTITCSTALIAANGGTFTVHIRITAVNSGPVENSATISAIDQCDRNTEDNTSSCSVTVDTNNQPVGLEADREGCGTDADCPTLVSDVNRVFEPNETARVDPAWKNTLDNADPDVTGTASALTGPGDGSTATYNIDDSTADYGPIPAGSTADCNAATNDCYAFTITQTGGTRPNNGDHPRHWDASFHEALSSGETFDWQLHLGDSFPDVPRSNIFYRYVETIFHNHITIGCQGGNIFCPADHATRQEMAAFISRSILLRDINIPVVTADYDCSNPATPVAGQFLDVPATNGFCKHANYLKTVHVTLGCFDSTHFCPLNDVLRSEMAVFIARAYVYKASLTPGPATTDPDGDVPQWKQSADLSRQYNCTGSDQIDPDTLNSIPANTAPFLDVPVGSASCKHIGFLFTTTIQGDSTKFIIDGDGAGHFLPNNLIRRDETAKILANAFGDLPLYGPLVF